LFPGAVHGCCYVPNGDIWFGGDGLARWRQGEFKVFTVSDGFPKCFVHKIAASLDGVIWIATDHHLLRHDGTRFENITQDLGLIDVDSPQVTPDASVWFGSRRGAGD
jgi:hypothetical protein